MAYLFVWKEKRCLVLGEVLIVLLGLTGCGGKGHVVCGLVIELVLMGVQICVSLFLQS